MLNLADKSNSLYKQAGFTEVFFYISSYLHVKNHKQPKTTYPLKIKVDREIHYEIKPRVRKKSSLILGTTVLGGTTVHK